MALGLPLGLVPTLKPTWTPLGSGFRGLGFRGLGFRHVHGSLSWFPSKGTSKGIFSGGKKVKSKPSTLNRKCQH